MASRTSRNMGLNVTSKHDYQETSSNIKKRGNKDYLHVTFELGHAD